MLQDPRQVLDQRPMSLRQYAAVGVAIVLNALDGFDVLAISFASPGIAAEWSIDQAELGVVLSLELVGMVIGSLFLGGLADRYGRRPIILGCLFAMATGMALAATATSIMELAFWRILTGLGVGGMVASLNAVVAEFANARNRSLAVALMVAGYPAGAVIGGSVSAVLLQGGDWRSVFVFGAVATACTIPLVWLLVPESVSFLIEQRSAKALARLNRVLNKLGISRLTEMPAVDVTQEQSRTPLVQLFAPGQRATTLLVTAAYLGHIITFYFVLKWTAKLVADMGFEPSAAATVLVWTNVGGIFGALVFGVLSRWIPLKTLAIAILACSFLAVWNFGNTPAVLTSLSIAAVLTGIFINAGVAAIYAIFAQSFPSKLRATGTGFGVGAGRGGAILSPILAGLFLDAGWGMDSVALVMGMGSILGAIALVLTPSSRRFG